MYGIYLTLASLALLAGRYQVDCGAGRGEKASPLIPAEDACLQVQASGGGTAVEIRNKGEGEGFPGYLKMPK